MTLRAAHTGKLYSLNAVWRPPSRPVPCDKLCADQTQDQVPAKDQARAWLQQFSALRCSHDVSEGARSVCCMPERQRLGSAVHRRACMNQSRQACSHPVSTRLNKLKFASRFAAVQDIRWTSGGGHSDYQLLGLLRASLMQALPTQAWEVMHGHPDSCALGQTAIPALL